MTPDLGSPRAAQFRRNPSPAGDGVAPRRRISSELFPARRGQSAIPLHAFLKEVTMHKSIPLVLSALLLIGFMVGFAMLANA